MAIRLGKRFGFDEVILESDCQVVIKCLSKSVLYLSYLDIILHDILASCSSFSSLVWSPVKRDGNFVARHLAKLVLELNKYGKIILPRR